MSTLVVGQMAKRQMAEWTYGRKTYDRKDILPKDIWPNRHVTARQMTKWTYVRKTSDRKDISPKGRIAEKHGETNIWPITHTIRKIYHKSITPSDIWLPLRIPYDTNSKVRNRCIARGSDKKVIFNENHLFVFYI